MLSSEDPRHLSLFELQKRCHEETLNFLKRVKEEAWNCYEIFRRACVEKDSAAWNIVYVQYQKQVQRWVEHHPRFHDFYEEADILVNLVFEKFWKRNFSAVEFAGFSNLRKVLAYLKTCVGSVITDYWRTQKRTLDVVYLEDVLLQNMYAQAFSYHARMDRKLEWEDFWKDLRGHLRDDVAFWVIYASFAMDLKPNDIYSMTPERFADVREVYNIKAKTIPLLGQVLQEMGRLSDFLDLAE
ncbi:MAG: hypothetical protein HUU38_18180 [Anaerolineales bacterium]|nr:hypothetical protein [Anaerolineales bacterium]